jgi:hypothetical protein
LRWGLLNCFCQDWPLTTILFIFASWIARVTGVSYQGQFYNLTNLYIAFAFYWVWQVM